MALLEAEWWNNITFLRTNDYSQAREKPMTFDPPAVRTPLEEGRAFEHAVQALRVLINLYRARDRARAPAAHSTVEPVEARGGLSTALVAMGTDARPRAARDAAARASTRETHQVDSA